MAAAHCWSKGETPLLFAELILLYIDVWGNCGDLFFLMSLPLLSVLCDVPAAVLLACRLPACCQPAVYMMC